MHIVRESDIPIMSDNANCMNSLLSALKYIYMHAAATYKNHNTYGIIKLRYHQEAKPSGELKFLNKSFKNREPSLPAMLLLHTQLNALVEGQDFDLDITGKITLKRP